MTTLPDGRILLFGGEDDPQNIYNDIFAYDSKQWSPITSVNTPPAARRNQTTWYRDGKLYIHGGVAKNHEMLDDLWAFDIAKKQWAEVQTGANKPLPRYGHAAIPLSDGSVILTGGTDAKGFSMKDTWKLNADKTYTLLGYCPVAMTKHVVQLVDGVMYLFGEAEKVVTYNISTNKWTELAGGPPISSAATSALGVNPAGQKIIYLFGGVDKNDAESSAVYEYNTSTKTVSQRTEHMPFTHSEGACAGLADNSILFFGGKGNSQYINTTFLFTGARSINNPVPAITSLNPNLAMVGGAKFTLAVNGGNFVNSSVVRWNGSDRPTTFVSETQLTASIPASDIATVAVITITVWNPEPGGGTSNSMTFSIIISSSGGSGGCFIATAAFGTPIEKHVSILREFRDRCLLKTSAGKAFVKFYYEVSPPIAGKIAQNEGLRFITRCGLMPFVGMAYLMVTYGGMMVLLSMLVIILMMITLVWTIRRRAETG